MPLIEQIEADVAASMKAGDATRTGTLRLLRGSFKNEQIKLGHELSDDETLKVLTREAKQRRDSIEAYEKAGRNDLVKVEQDELSIIEHYLPTPLSDEELVALVDQAIEAQGNPDMAGMGKVIAAVVSAAGAQADGGRIAKVVRERLA